MLLSSTYLFIAIKAQARTDGSVISSPWFIMFPSLYFVNKENKETVFETWIGEHEEKESDFFF